MEDAVVLYRPIGPAEMRLIEQSDWTTFPLRLPTQPIFYPVLNEEYARQIARDWNVKESGAGFVTKFRVLKSFLDQYEVHRVGAAVHDEYWIPAEELGAFNHSLIGPIEVIADYHASAST